MTFILCILQIKSTNLEEAAPVFYDQQSPAAAAISTTTISQPLNDLKLCEAIHHRGILWPSTRPGSVAIQPCLNGTLGSWQCTAEGQWASKSEADLSRCQSKKWEAMEVRQLSNIVVGSGLINLYGGDLRPLLDRVTELTDQFSTQEAHTR